ncbi:MAG: DNA-binding protein [Desulfobacteraceae bacterium]|nr:DNA-binding protein [Desulfobacteraceae bacterium]MCP4349971.1 DNA-binding protein [Desulfobacterales bacterium]
MELTIELTESQFEKLQETAKRLGLLPGQVASSAVTDLLTARDEEFCMATDYVLKKNKELYRRLS